MGFSQLLRNAADMSDKAASAITEAAGSAMSAAKEKAADLRGIADNEADVYESAVTAVGDAIADSGQMNSDIMSILQAIRDDNPYN